MKKIAKQLTPEIQRLTDEAFHYYSTRQTDKFFATVTLGPIREQSGNMGPAEKISAMITSRPATWTSECIKMK